MKWWWKDVDPIQLSKYQAISQHRTLHCNKLLWFVYFTISLFQKLQIYQFLNRSMTPHNSTKILWKVAYRSCFAFLPIRYRQQRRQLIIMEELDFRAIPTFKITKQGPGPFLYNIVYVVLSLWVFSFFGDLVLYKFVPTYRWNTSYFRLILVVSKKRLILLYIL
jgi:hypothetical protein